MPAHGELAAAHEDRAGDALARAERQPLPGGVVRRMRKLVTIRNQLVHDRGVNAVDRAALRDGSAAAERELRTLLPADSMPFCVIS